MALRGYSCSIKDCRFKICIDKGPKLSCLDSSSVGIIPEQFQCPSCLHGQSKPVPVSTIYLHSGALYNLVLQYEIRNRNTVWLYATPTVSPLVLHCLVYDTVLQSRSSPARKITEGFTENYYADPDAVRNKL